MSGDLSLDDLTRQLSAIRDRLLALNPAEHAERYRLQCEQDRLRGLARGFARNWDAMRRTEDLVAELRARRSELDDIRRRMICLWSGTTLNQAMKRAGGIDDLIQRIARLESILGERDDR